MQLTKQQTSVLYKLVQGVKNEEKEQTLGGYAGTGKAQPLDSIIITPQGMRLMGDMQIGDLVCTPSGQSAKITGIFPQGVKSIYRIWFNDGHYVDCCNDHLWKCIDRRRLSNLKKYKTPYKVFPLSYIREFIQRPDGKNRFYIETSKAIQFNSVEKLDIDPYLMGVLLADGSITDDNFAIHSDDFEIREKCENLLKNWSCNLKHKEGVTYSIVGKGRGSFSTSVEIRNVLRDIGVWNCICENKFIPQKYLQSELNSRWQLLQGLMDSDGHVDHRSGMVGYSTTSSRLAADICFLVESLGGICRIKNKDTKCVYKGKIVLGTAWVLNISFNNTPDVFFLKRKKDLAKLRTKYKTRRCIRDIEYIGEKEAQCIMIDHQDHLYLTDHFIPTHNTTLIKYLCNFFPNFGVAAYTGKAANVLRKKDIQASTIHSRIYIPVIDYGVLMGFELAPKDDLGCQGFIIDEASMVSKEIYEDLKSYDLPMIYVGDHGQLEPIGNDFNLISSPMYRLEEIHRNANDIAKFAEFLRKGRNSYHFKGQEEDRVQFISKKYVDDDELMNVEQIICAYNATRVDLNKRVRAALGYTGGVRVGDRVMCLKNNKQLNLFNGMQGFVKRLYEGRNGRPLMDFEFDNTVFNGIWYDKKWFNTEKTDFDYMGGEYPNPFDYAYAITCHKAQGDEFESVLVMEQKCKNWDHKRWAYTAASRAKNLLKWAF